MGSTNNQSNMLNEEIYNNKQELIDHGNVNTIYGFKYQDINPFFYCYNQAMSNGVLENSNIYTMNNNHMFQEIIGFNKFHQSYSDLTGNSIYFSLDEKETKKLKRKQSNRESARRSRMRKQAEAEELQKKKLKLEYENHILRRDIEIYRQDYFRAITQIAKYRKEIDRLTSNLKNK